MRFITVWRTVAALLLCAVGSPTWALNNSVPGVYSDVSRALLGDGTGVIIGIIDSGVDDTHPALAGLDSLGNPRMVAEKNFASDGGAIADDVFGHGTKVASAALSRHATYTGMATDARYINARVLDSANSFDSDVRVRNGIGYAIDNGADILNLSLNYGGANNDGFSSLDLMVDWAAFDRRISTTIAAGNINSITVVRGPASAFNGVAVGRTIADLSKVSITSAGAFTGDGRMKPDIVAPGTLLTLANDDWETAADWTTGHNGTSYAAPHVAGLMAQMLEAGTTRGLSVDPLVVKASIMNSASKNVLDRDFNPWEQSGISNTGGVITVTKPLDSHSGAGLIDGLALSQQYLAGEMSPGLVDSIGWDLNSIGAGQFIDYAIDPNLTFGSTFTATLAWYRHVGRSDNGNGIVDAGDSFFLSQTLSNLDLQILRNGSLVAQSMSAFDNVEHLHIAIDTSAQYTLRVLGSNVFGGSEQFALAWYGTAVPEPATAVLMLFATLWLGLLRRR